MIVSYFLTEGGCFQQNLFVRRIMQKLQNLFPLILKFFWKDAVRISKEPITFWCRSRSGLDPQLFFPLRDFQLCLFLREYFMNLGEKKSGMFKALKFMNLNINLDKCGFIRGLLDLGMWSTVSIYRYITVFFYTCLNICYVIGLLTFSNIYNTFWNKHFPIKIKDKFTECSNTTCGIQPLPPQHFTWAFNRPQDFLLFFKSCTVFELFNFLSEVDCSC